MSETDPFARDEAAWRTRARGRGKKGRFPWHIVAALGALLLVGGGLTAWLLLRDDRPTRAAKALATDWETLAYHDLAARWFTAGFNSSRQAKTRRLFAERNWLTTRPPLRFVLCLTSDPGHISRSEYEVEGYPADPRLKVYWSLRGDVWVITNMRIPLPVEERQDE